MAVETEKKKVAIQGIRGSFHHQAATHFFGEGNFKLIGKRHFRDVFESLDWGDIDVGVIAIENSIYGSIYENYDLLNKYNFPIVGEVFLKIEHNLIVLPETNKEDVKKVFSHPVALRQCEKYLQESRLEVVHKADTAKSVLEIKEKGIRDAAAIGSATAAEIYGMKILDRGIQDVKNNYTRFLVLTKKANVTDFDKVSLNLHIKNEPGSLLKILNIIKEHDGDMTKIESRPIFGEVWQYQFYIDILTNPNSFEPMLKEIQSHSTKVRVLGKYKKGEFVG